MKPNLFVEIPKNFFDKKNRSMNSIRVDNFSYALYGTFGQQNSSRVTIINKIQFCYRQKMSYADPFARGNVKFAPTKNRLFSLAGVWD